MWSPLRFTKGRDDQSVELFHLSTAGSPIPSGTLEAFSPAATAPYATWSFKDLLVSNYSSAMGPADEATLAR